jgi:hypothetical protein
MSQLFHRLPDLVPRRRPVDVVHLVEVDVVGLESTETGSKLVDSSAA